MQCLDQAAWQSRDQSSNLEETETREAAWNKQAPVKQRPLSYLEDPLINCGTSMEHPPTCRAARKVGKVLQVSSSHHLFWDRLVVTTVVLELLLLLS